MVEAPSGRRGQDRARRVLVVDDDPDILQTLALCLSTEGYRVQMAANGKDALEVLALERPAIILLDL
ncbi:MAG: response regulator, partial [Myxococcaceae bacterium]